MSAALVSVLVPSHNYARYLPVTLKSALEQTFADFELLIVEDGSTDQSLAVARAFAARDNRARVLTHPDGKNLGLPATLALGLAHARGRWIAFLEADDLWRPDCLERRLEALRHSGAEVALNNIAPLPMPGAKTQWFEGYVPRVMRWHEAQSAETSAMRAPGASMPGDIPPHGASGINARLGQAYDAGNAFLLENKIPTFSCAMVRAELLRAVSLRSPVPRWLDWWVWAQLAQRAKFAYVPEKLTRWRLHPKSWNAKVRPASYMDDYRAMGRGLRRLYARELMRDGQWRWLGFLFLPAFARVAARFARPLAEDGLSSTLRRVWSRLNFSGGIWKL